MSKVVFVGNVPYNMSEEDLIDVFKSVGQVVGFRLVFDRDTGKPRGYGFCEFADHETALSSVRNLNGVDVGGRPLRIDLADSDPFLEGKTTVRGEIIDGGGQGGWSREGAARRADPNAFLRDLPAGVPVPPGGNALDAITHNLATMNPSQLIEVLAQMKAFIITHPEQARALLVAHPQLAYALFQALVLNNIVDPSVLQRMIAAGGGMPSAPVPAPPAPVLSAPAAQPSIPPYGQPPFAPTGMSMHMTPPPPPGMYGQGPPSQSTGLPGSIPPPVNQYYRPPPAQQAPPAAAMPPPVPAPAPATAAAPVAAGIDPSQQALLMHVLSLTPEQISAMPPAEQETIRALRSQFMGARV